MNEAGIGSPADAETAACREEALRILARGERTRRKLADALRPRFRAEVIAPVIADLSARGLVDDRRFARLFVERVARQKPQSVRSLENRLRKEGCDAETAREAVREARLDVDGFDETSLARRFLEKKLRMGIRDRDKMLAALARRGFSRRVATEAWAAVTREEADR